MTKHSDGSKPEQTKSVSSASSLGGQDWYSEVIEALDNIADNNYTLVAPNETVAADWRKEYPNYKVVLAQRLPLTDSHTEGGKNATSKQKELI